MVSALVVVSDGSEEMEAVIVVDVLRRSDIVVTVAGLEGVDVVKMSRGVMLKPDSALSECATQLYDVVILPGGLGGANAFCKSDLLKDIVMKHENEGKYIAAICAAPIAFAAFGVGKEKKVTSYPGMKETMVNAPHGYTYLEHRVVVDGKVVTSRGPGTAFEFALKLVQLLVSDEKSKQLHEGMLLQ